MQLKSCRVCFETDEDTTKLISPCDCKGSSLYIHEHCLDHWQEIALHSSLPERASICPVCKSRYRHRSWIFMLYRKTIHMAKYHVNVALALCSLLWLSLVIIPLKVFIHAVLVVITLPFGSFSMNGMSLTWIGYDFPPQLALVHDSNGEQVPELRAGVLLVASQDMPSASMFYKSIVLVLEHSVEYGTKGVIINNLSHNLKINDYILGSGGPMEQEICTVVHTSKLCSRYSYVLNEHERIYVSESENAYATLKQLSLRRRECQSNGPAIAESVPQIRTTEFENKPKKKEVKQRDSEDNCAGTAGTSAGKCEVRVVRGTCAWNTFQLDGEVLAGKWHILPGTKMAMFPPLPQQVNSTLESETSPSRSLYGNQRYRHRNCAYTCDTSHWEALHATVAHSVSSD